MRPFFIPGHQFSAMPILPIFTLITILTIKCIVPRRLSGKLTCDFKVDCYSAISLNDMRVTAVTDGNEPPFITATLCSSFLKLILADRLHPDFTVIV